MNAPPERELLETIATELGVDPSFVEKDWHAIRLVGVLAGIEHAGLRPAFSGGTSLSKGYGLIKRFSEDLDFKLIMPGGGVLRPDRRAYRTLVAETIRGAGDWTIEGAEIKSRNKSRFFSLPIRYREIFSQTSALRRDVKLDVSFRAPVLPVEERPLRSFVAEARREDAEVAAIACVSPVETAADKLSALTWRVLTRQGDTGGGDPTLMRHLHDLAALENLAVEYADIPELLRTVFDQDTTEHGRAHPEIAGMTPADRVSKALATVADDPGYSRDYERFVLNMSYAAEDETPGFEAALAAARHLGEFLP